MRPTYSASTCGMHHTSRRHGFSSFSANRRTVSRDTSSYPNLGFPTVQRCRMGHFKEPSARDRTMRDVFQGSRALGSMDRELRLVWLYCVIEDAVRQILG